MDLVDKRAGKALTRRMATLPRKTDESNNNDGMNDVNDEDDFGGLFISNVRVRLPAKTSGIRPLILTKKGGGRFGGLFGRRKRE